MLTIFNDLKILKTLKFSAMTASSAVFLPEESSIISGTNDYKSKIQAMLKTLSYEESKEKENRSNIVNSFVIRWYDPIQGWHLGHSIC